MSFRLDAGVVQWHMALIVLKGHSPLFGGQAHNFPFYSKYSQLASPAWKQTTKPKPLLGPTEFPPYTTQYSEGVHPLASIISSPSPHPTCSTVCPGLCSKLHRLSCQAHQWPTCSESKGHAPVHILLNLPYQQKHGPLFTTHSSKHVFLGSHNSALPWFSLFLSGHLGSPPSSALLMKLWAPLTLFIFLGQQMAFVSVVSVTIYKLMTLSLYFSPTSLL